MHQQRARRSAPRWRVRPHWKRSYFRWGRVRWLPLSRANVYTRLIDCRGLRIGKRGTRQTLADTWRGLVLPTRQFSRLPMGRWRLEKASSETRLVPGSWWFLPLLPLRFINLTTPGTWDSLTVVCLPLSPRATMRNDRTTSVTSRATFVHGFLNCAINNGAIGDKFVRSLRPFVESFWMESSKP